MPLAQQSFVNDQKGPIYISVEPNPECYELEPGERLTLIYTAPLQGDGLTVYFANASELVIWPTELTPDPVVLINDKPANDRSWNFKHR